MSSSTSHPPVEPRKGSLGHDHRGATWTPTACETHRARPCPLHDPETFDQATVEDAGLYPAAGFQESCEACRKTKQEGYRSDCPACVETWELTREHAIAVQLHEEAAERRAKRSGR